MKIMFEDYFMVTLNIVNKTQNQIEGRTLENDVSMETITQ